jgi:hypothetical protein
VDNKAVNTLAKGVFLAALYVYILSVGVISWHLNDGYLSSVFWVAVLFYIATCIFLRKYFFLLVFFVSYVLLFTLSYNPYTVKIVSSGIIEKEISYERGTIFVVRFEDGSAATVIYGEDKQCIGREYEGKERCRMVLSALDKLVSKRSPGSGG